VTLRRADLDEVILGGKPKLEAKMAAGDIKVEGKPKKLGELFSLLDNFDPTFNIVTP
jgi:alkyl sulfatase BDS1-like metallo-beta-lactamase superfamily hydrolase